MIPKDTLQDWIEGIKNEIIYVGLKPYSHNIIQISLQAIAEDFGIAVANEVIEDLDLERLGWEKKQL